jgi:hypothetical protein
MSLFHKPRPSEPEEELQPCPHMRTLLSRLADNSLRGLLRRYTVAHVAQCAHCRSALTGLEVLVVRLRHLIPLQGDMPATPAAGKGLAPERWTQVEQHMTETDSKNNTLSPE